MTPDPQGQGEREEVPGLLEADMAKGLSGQSCGFA